MPKNQSLSLLIGPPSEADSSNSFWVLLTVFRPRCLNSSLRLSPSRLLLENRPASVVLKVLLPSFGMMFTTTPSAFVSAEIPLVDITISSTDDAVSWKLLLPELFSMPMPSYETLVPDLPWKAPPPDTTSLPGSTWYWPPTSPMPESPVVSEAREEMLLLLTGSASSSSLVTTCLPADVLHVDDWARASDGHLLLIPRRRATRLRRSR